MGRIARIFAWLLVSLAVLMVIWLFLVGYLAIAIMLFLLFVFGVIFELSQRINFPRKLLSLFTVGWILVFLTLLWVIYELFTGYWENALISLAYFGLGAVYSRFLRRRR
jgi:hypothetical protein